MNELDLIASVRPEVPLPGADDLAAARRRLNTGLSAPAPQPRDGRRARLTRVRPSWSPGAVMTTAAAAGIVITLVVISAVSAGRTHEPGGHQRKPGLAQSSPAQSGPAQSGPARSGHATLTAAAFLTVAAAATRNARAIVPRPDQYIYTLNVGSLGYWNKVWLSTDGSRTGLSIGSGQPAYNLQYPCTAVQAASTDCFLRAGYLPGLPTQANEVLAYLAKLHLAMASLPPGESAPNWLANDVGKAVAYLLSKTYLLPAQQSAVFRLLAWTPGFRLIRNAADALGRSGVGIYWPYEGGGDMIVFDPVTYRYLGFGTWPEGQGPTMSARPVVAPDGDALATMAVVGSEPSLPRPSSTLRALVRQAKAWITRQHHHQPWTVVAALTAYLRQVRHMSPAKISQVLAELGFLPGPAPIPQPSNK